MPAGLGALDGGLIGALVLHGAPVAPSAAAVVLYRGITLLVPVVLGAAGCTVRRPRMLTRKRPAAQAGDEPLRGLLAPGA
jgi:hypothetical protein